MRINIKLVYMQPFPSGHTDGGSSKFGTLLTFLTSAFISTQSALLNHFHLGILKNTYRVNIILKISYLVELKKILLGQNDTDSQRVNRASDCH